MTKYEVRVLGGYLSGGRSVWVDALDAHHAAQLGCEKLEADGYWKNMTLPDALACDVCESFGEHEWKSVTVLVGHKHTFQSVL